MAEYIAMVRKHVAYTDCLNNNKNCLNNNNNKMYSLFNLWLHGNINYGFFNEGIKRSPADS